MRHHRASGTNENSARAHLQPDAVRPSTRATTGSASAGVRWHDESCTNAVLGNYGLSSTSAAAIGQITAGNSLTTYNAAPTDDFFGTLRKTNNAVDIGAVEFTDRLPPWRLPVSPRTLTFPTTAVVHQRYSEPDLHNTGTATLSAINVAITVLRARHDGAFPAGEGTAYYSGRGHKLHRQVAFAPPQPVRQLARLPSLPASR